VPRDSTETRARLREEAERLFASRGVWQVTVREITEAAGQRNASAVSYHFGSREGILREILLHHGLHLDDERGRLLDQLGEAATTRDLVAALLVPFAAPLATDAGRNYLRIVAQLTERFGSWRTVDDDELTPPYLRRILAMLEERPPSIPPPVRRQRVIGVIMLMTTAMAARARALQSGRRVELDEETFLANLADMLVGALEAPLGGPLSP
jgi:TetR/AcrR family transcriptional regulator, regulator of cefoperazone and chloramphenicol sensitivity